MFIKLHKVRSSRTSSELTKWGWCSSKKHTLSCAQGVPPASNLGFVARAAMSESGQQGPACNPDVWAHFTDLNCEEHAPRANKAHTAFGSSSWGPAVAVDGAAFLLAYLIVHVITRLWHVRTCQVSHKSCSPTSMHFAKISKMKKPRAWAPWPREPQGAPALRHWTEPLSSGKALWVCVWTLLPEGGISQSPLSLYNLCRDPK